MLSQANLKSDCVQDTSQYKEKKTANLTNMDCEGFQDLGGWCATPLSGYPLLNIDEDRFDYNEDTLDCSKVEEGSTYYSGCAVNSVEDTHWAESHYSVNQEFSTTNMEQNVQNNNNLYYQETVAKDEVPEYMETVEISSDSSDLLGKDMEEFVSVGVLTSQDSEPWQMYEVNELIQNVENNGVSTDYASKVTDNNNTVFVEYATPSDGLSELENKEKDTWSLNTMNNSQLLKIANSGEETDDGAISLPSIVEQSNNTIISTLIIEDLPEMDLCKTFTAESEYAANINKNRLQLKVNKRPFSSSTFSSWVEDPVVTTPDVLRTIEQLENDKSYNLMISQDDKVSNTLTSYPLESPYDLTPPDTPKVKSRKRRQDSEDSDASYVPETKISYKRSKKSNMTSIPKKIIKEFPIELYTPARRGRPPKRRESASSSGTYVDDSSCAASCEDKYRERRDRNNEASRRSRYQRKQKDLETILEADKLEERNEVLRKQAVILEEKTRLLKEALIKAMSGK